MPLSDSTLVGRAVGEQAGAAELALWFEVRQQRGTRQNHRDDDAKSDRAAVELRSGSSNNRVSWRTMVFEPAQKTPAANLTPVQAKPQFILSC